MAKKRFTDIEIWDREWYMELTPKHKCLMKYIFDKCDPSGCWKPNWKLASLHINDDVNFSDLSYLPKDQYEILENGKIFIPDFIKFQYGTLSEKSPAHNPIFLAIEKNNLSNRVFNRVSNTPKEEDIDKEEEKDKEKEKEEPKKNQKKSFNTRPSASDFNGLPDAYYGKSIELVFHTARVNIDADTVRAMWEIFKVQKLTGEDYHANEGKVYSYFMDWLKKQNFNNNGTNKQPIVTNKFNAGALELLAKGKEQFAAIARKQNGGT